MGQRFTFVLPGDSDQLSLNKRLHWRRVAERKKVWRTSAYLEVASALNSGAVKPFQGRVRISFIVRRGRRIDPDNAASSGATKAVLDGIVEAGLIADDSLLFCSRGEVTQEPNKIYRDRPELVVVLEEVGAIE